MCVCNTYIKDYSENAKKVFIVTKYYRSEMLNIKFPATDHNKEMNLVNKAIKIDWIYLLVFLVVSMYNTFEETHVLLYLWRQTIIQLSIQT